MRRLILMRHATPELEPFDADRERPLSPRGVHQAAAAAEHLATRDVGLVLCSPALRTRQTLAHLRLDAPVQVLEKLYFCGTNTLLQQVGDVDATVTSLLVVGHSPPVPGLAARLASGAHPALAEQLWSDYPEATWTEFEVDGPWDALARMPYALARLVGVHRGDEQ